MERLTPGELSPVEQRAPGRWQVGTVTQVKEETPRVKSFRIELPMWVPHLYFWKSAKWIAGLRLLDHDEPGFWEQNGYHARGNPWEEQRYAGD